MVPGSRGFNAEWASTFVRPRFGGLREKMETSQGRNSQGRDLAGASVSAGARLLYALLDAPTDLATSIVQRSRNLAATAIQTFAHNSIAATVQVDPPPAAREQLGAVRMHVAMVIGRR